MIQAKIVTGYVPIATNPRPAAEYAALGEKLRELAPTPIHPFYNTVEDCWVSRYLKRHNLVPKWSQADNPKKNTLAYHIVQHQKFEWLVHAAAQDKAPDTLVWVDYGIHHVPGVTTAVIVDYLTKLDKGDLAIPGCWSKDDPRVATVGDDWPNWRFCGGVMAVPREHVWPLFVFVRKQLTMHLKLTNNIPWEVNTLVGVERGGQLPIRWYAADHNETIFSGYKKDPPCVL